MKGDNPNYPGHNEVWESIMPTRGGTLKRGTPSTTLEEQQGSVVVHHYNLTCHNKAGEYVTTIAPATTKGGGA